MPTIDLRGLAMSYEQTGSGPDIVWVSGGGSRGKDWHPYQVPWFADRFRNTTFDNRGIGGTRPLDADAPESWSIEDMADDLAELIERVCTPPVYCVGLSMGSLITQKLAIRQPELLRSAIVMGTLARAYDWPYDFMKAEIEWRRAGRSLSGMMGATHYAAFSYPASALGDPAVLANIYRYLDSEEWTEGNEESLVPQWEACNAYDVTAELPTCAARIDVIAFEQDVQTPPVFGQEVARLAGDSSFRMIPDSGHYSCWGHRHDEINQAIDDIIAADARGSA